MTANQKVASFLLAATTFAMVGGGFSSQGMADSEAAGRNHAAKANRLAAKNKCKAALPEFNRAYKTLKDPTLLFNRAECYRQLGRIDEAIEDYQQFLVDMPGTSNRASVEARIASLRGESAKEGAKAPTAVKEAPATGGKEPAAQAAKPAETPPVPSASKPAERAPAASAAAVAKPVEKAPAASAPVAKPVEKATAAPAPAPADKAPAAPARRAEKWTD